MFDISSIGGKIVRYWVARLRAWWSMRTRKQRVIIGVIGLILLASAIYIPLYIKFKNLKSARGNTSAAPAVDTNETAVSGLDGTEAQKSLANRHPLAVIVENHPDARPQFGLSEAGLVYEALTEGGITRFMAIYGPRDAAKIGPVRSARTYYIDWCAEFDAFFAHAGGAQNALTKIVKDDIRDLPHNQSAYWRETGKVSLEHTLFTSTTKLYEYAENQGFDPKTGSYRGWIFKKELATSAQGVAGTKVTINFSSAEYRVDWNYNSASNTYERSQAGSAHKDASTGAQLSASNILMLTMPRSLVESGGKAVYSMETTGSGKAIVLQDGRKIEGKWQKAKSNDRTVILDSTGKEVSFNPGPTWVEIINPDAVTVTVQ